MNFFRLRALFVSLVSLVATAAFAVEQLPEKEEDIPVEYIPRLDYTVSVGLHRLTKGPRVRFGNLGSVPLASSASPDTTDTVSKVYGNGSITKDSLNIYEQDANGKPLAAGSTFETSGWISKVDATGNTVTVYTPVLTAQPQTGTDANGNPTTTYTPATTPVVITNPDGSTIIADTNVYTWASTGKYLTHKDGQTRSWSVTDAANQVNTTNHTVSMSTHGAASRRDVTIDADSNGSTGFEVTLERKLGQLGRFEWGVSGGLKLVQINAKASRVLQSDLVLATDVYQMVNTGLNKPDGIYFVVPSAGTSVTQPTDTTETSDLPSLDLSGDPVKMYGSATTVVTKTTGSDQSTATPIETTPISSYTNYRAGVVNVHGFWQLKGAYYMVRFGPTFRYRFNDRIAISGSIGAAIGYVGTVFRADEYYNNYDDVYELDGTTPKPLIANAANSTFFRSQEQNNTHKFIPGYYGEINAEYWMTERTGFYLGLTQQTMRDFTQTPLSGRTAKIDMGSSSGWRMGIMTRF